MAGDEQYKRFVNSIRGPKVSSLADVKDAPVVFRKQDELADPEVLETVQRLQAIQRGANQ